MKYHFASDNTAGIVPEAWDALAAANRGFAAAYGEDEWTARASDCIRELFETDCDVYFVFTGTAANSLALAGICRPQHKVICHRLSHIATAECGGPAFFHGAAGLEVLGRRDGKIRPADIERVSHAPYDFHHQLSQGGVHSRNRRSRHCFTRLMKSNAIGEVRKSR